VRGELVPDRIPDNYAARTAYKSLMCAEVKVLHTDRRTGAETGAVSSVGVTVARKGGVQHSSVAPARKLMEVAELSRLPLRPGPCLNLIHAVERRRLASPARNHGGGSQNRKIGSLWSQQSPCGTIDSRPKLPGRDGGHRGPVAAHGRQQEQQGQGPDRTGEAQARAGAAGAGGGAGV